jgi:hypothetical protein
VRHIEFCIRKGILKVKKFPLSGLESISFHRSSTGGSVTIMGLVELPSGRISDAQRSKLKPSSFTDSEGEYTHGS